MFLNIISGTLSIASMGDDDPLEVWDMKIYWIKAQAPQRVLALAKHLGIRADFVEVDVAGGGLKAADYRMLNPNSKAPTLVDGDVVLWEASAIMAYLCVKT